MPDYGSARRAKERQNKKLKVRLSALSAISDEWDKWGFLESGKLKAGAIDSFYHSVRALEQKNTTNGNLEREVFREAFREFVRGKIEEFPSLEIPGRLPIIKREPPIKSRDWMVKGKRIRTASQEALRYWSEHDEYSEKEALGWLLFSAIVWGGLNNEAAVEALLVNVQKKSKLNLFRHVPVSELSVESPRYGNIEGDNELLAAISFVPDVITQLWMTHCYRRLRVLRPLEVSAKACVSEVLCKISADVSFDSLLKNASYVWEQLPGSSVPQALVRVATGHQKACSLTGPEFARAVSGHLYVKPIFSDTPRYNRLKAHQETRQLSSSVDPKLLRHNKDLIGDLRTGIWERDKLTGKKAQQALHATHQKLRETYVQNHEHRLIDWVYSMLFPVGKLTTSSVNRYLNAVGYPWLNHAQSDTLDLMETEDWEEFYFLSFKEAKDTRGFRTNCAREFHQFQVIHYEAPPATIDGETTTEFCKARFLSPQFMNCLFECLRRSSTFNEIEREMIEVIITLAWRTGMRISEITRLLMKDLDCLMPVANCGTRGQIYSLVVRANRYADNKSGNALRRIPVVALLKKSELALFEKVWRYRLGLNKKGHLPVFTPIHTEHIFSNSFISSVFKDLTQSVMPGCDYSFHSLRHTALSTLSMVLTEQDCVLEQLSDLSKEEKLGIRRALLGNHPGNAKQQGQDHYFALAQVAGHSLPDQTFRSYLHFAHLELGIRLSQGEMLLPAQAVTNIAQFSSRRLVINIDGHSRVKSHLSRQALAPLIMKDLSQWVGEWQELAALEEPLSPELGLPHHVSIPYEDVLSGNDPFPRSEKTRDLDVFPGQQVTRITMDVVYAALKKYEEGSEIRDIAQSFDLPVALVDRWIHRASILSNIKSGRGSPRLFDPARLVNSKNPPLLPTKAFSREEQLMIKAAFSWAARNFDSDKVQLLQFLNHFLKRTTASRAMIRFTVAKEEEMMEFLAIGTRMFDPRHWKVHAHQVALARRVRKSGGKYWEKMEVSKTPLTDFTGFGLTLRKPGEDKITQGKTKSHYSSNALKYVAHMMLISWPTGDLGRKRTQWDPVTQEIKKLSKKKLSVWVEQRQSRALW